MSTPPNRRGLLTRLLSAKTPEEIEVERLKLIARPDSADSSSLLGSGSEATPFDDSNPSGQNYTPEGSAIGKNHSLDPVTVTNNPSQINQTIHPHNKESIGHNDGVTNETVNGNLEQASLRDKTQDYTVSVPVKPSRTHMPRLGNAVSSKTESSSVLASNLSNEPKANNIQNATPLIRKRGITPVDRSFDLSIHLRRAKELYRLNRTEIALYETFLKWTHAIGISECSATNRKIGADNGLSEKNIRRGLKTLSTRGLIIQLQAYNPYNHEPAVFSVNIIPTLTKSS